MRDAPSCPICGTIGASVYRGLRDLNFNAPGEWTVRRCPSCHHGWLDPFPEAGELGKLYPSYWENYDSVFHRDVSASEGPGAFTLLEAVNRGALVAMGYPGVEVSPAIAFFAHLLPFAPPLMEIVEGTAMSLRWRGPGRLLDVGCGDGSFLVFMRSIGWNVSGVESDAQAAEVAKGRGLDVRVGDIESVDLLPGSYDAITMQHVIEHVREPVKVLRAVRAALKPDGVTSIRAPNLESLGHERFRRAWMPLEAPRHLHFFTPSTLSACVKEAGFNVVNVHTSPRIAQGVFDSSRATSGSSTVESPSAGRKRSIGSRIFIAQETLLCTIGRDVGEEIVVLATRR